MANNWSWIEPIIWGVVAALIAYNAVQGIGWLTTLKDIAAKTAHAVASAAETAAIIALMIAQDGLNAAMAACPITWIITAVIALIAVIVAVVRATNLWGAESTSVLGTITGLFAVAVAFIGNLLISLWNTVVDIFVLIYNFIGGIAVGIGTLFNDPVAGVIQLFYTLADTVLGVLETLASAIDTLFGSNLAGAVQGWRSSLKSWTEDTFGVEVWEGIDGDALKIDRINYGDAFSFGSSLGDGISDSIGSLFDTETLNVEDYVGGSAVTDFTLDDIASDTSSIADSASGIEDSLDISNEELSYLRDIAERDAINRFTTAEIQIDMTGMTNRIESDADLDGIISAFTDGFSEALLTAAEGVHA